MLVTQRERERVCVCVCPADLIQFYTTVDGFTDHVGLYQRNMKADNV